MIQLDGNAHQVVGVLPPSFRYFRIDDLKLSRPVKVELLKPSGLDVRNIDWEGDFNWGAIARLKPGTSVAQANSELNAHQARINGYGKENLDLHAKVMPLQEAVVGPAKRGLWMLLAAVGSVLLIVCVNIANLLLARSASRMREASIRTALGASRWDLIRQLAAESLVLGAAGGALGTAVAVWGVRMLIQTAPVDLPRLDEVSVDPLVLIFAGAASLFTAVLFTILPARRIAAAEPAEAIKTGSLTVTEGRRGLRTRAALVAVEVGLSAALLVIAGLLLGSFVKLMRIDRGFDVDHLISFEVAPAGNKYKENKQRVDFYTRALAAIEQLPGVRSVGLVSSLPLQGEHWVDIFTVEGDKRPIVQQPVANYRMVSPGYFTTLGIPLRTGRPFEEADRKRHAGIISSRLADRVWPGRSPLGRSFRSGDSDHAPYEIVGVAADIRGIDLQKDPGIMVYVPYWERVPGSASIAVRTAMDPVALISSLRSAVAGVDPEVPVARIRTMEKVVSDSVSERRFQMWLVLMFAGCALLLASLGIYGVLSYAVARRTREMGIRMAVGATTADLRRLVLAQGMVPVGIGLTLGVGAAVVLGRGIQALLFGVSAAEPLVIGSVVVVLGVVALAACWLPARRAARMNPVNALRYE
jgi:putative ABC transport system permease protein